MTSAFLISHPTGNTFVHALLQELESRDLLNTFHTTLAASTLPSPLNRLLPTLGKKRNYPVPTNRIHSHPIYEVFRLTSGLLSSHERRRRLTDNTYKYLDRAVAKALPLSRAQIVHAYEDGALQTFRTAKALGVLRSYELPIAHWRTARRLLSEEAERYPDWEPTLETTREPEEKLHRKDEELHLADLVTCPSPFVLNSIPEVIRNTKPCLLAPFGSPSPTNPRTTCLQRNNSLRSPLKVLFVGSMSQRKGLADLFAAFNLLDQKNFHLTIIGAPTLPLSFYRSKLSNFTHLSPMPRPQVLAAMREQDILALPSIVEGRALVQQEALSCGLPLLVTSNAGGDDLVEEERTGFLLPIRTPEAIAEKLEWFHLNKRRIFDMRHQCQAKSNEYSWNHYADMIINSGLRLNAV